MNKDLVDYLFTYLLALQAAASVQTKQLLP